MDHTHSVRVRAGGCCDTILFLPTGLQLLCHPQRDGVDVPTSTTECLLDQMTPTAPQQPPDVAPTLLAPCD